MEHSSSGTLRAFPLSNELYFILIQPNEIMHTEGRSAKTVFIHLLIY